MPSNYLTKLSQDFSELQRVCRDVMEIVNSDNTMNVQNTIGPWCRELHD